MFNSVKSPPFAFKLKIFYVISVNVCYICINHVIVLIGFLKNLKRIDDSAKKN